MKKLLFLLIGSIVLCLFGCESKVSEESVYVEGSVDKMEQASVFGDATEIKSESIISVDSETSSEVKTEIKHCSEAFVENGKLTDIHELNVDSEYVVKSEMLFRFRFPDKEYYIIQGGHFDGDRYYVAAIKKYDNGYEDAKILIMDATGKKIKESDSLPLDHANSITYNERINKLVVAHCHSVDGHYYRYSFVDPETLTITETADKEYPFFAIAYSSERNAYASGEWSGEKLDIWNGDFEHIKCVDVAVPGSLSQGVDCDDKGIYFVRSAQNGYPAEIRVYSWSCKLKMTVKLELDGNIEPESISVIDGEVYVVGTDWDRRCGVAFRLYFEEQ